MTMTTSAENGLGDLEKTLIINNLIETAFADRNENWVAEFLPNIDGTNLKLASQEVIIANDGFPYLQLETIKSDESFRAFVINKQLAPILQQGFGIVINANNPQPDWVFSYGDIVNFEINDEFYTDDSIFSKDQQTVSLSTDEKVLTGQPSDAILPKYLRKQLREFLNHHGIKSPKIMLIARNYEDEQKVSQDLVFNLTPAQFASENIFQEVLRTITWFLPKHYSFFCIDESSIDNGFENL